MTRQFVSAAIFVMFVTGSWVVFAHEGHEHKIIGTVTMAAADHVMVKTKDGKETTVKIVATTKVMQGKQAVKIESLKVETRVVITATGDKEPFTAKLIQVGVVAPANAAPKPK